MREIMYLNNGKMPVSTPEEQGVSSASILRFMREIRRNDLALHCFQIVRHGKLVASAIGAPYTEESYHRIYSAAKGVVATAVLMAIQEGYLEMDAPVLPLIPAEWLPEDLDEKWSRLTLYHLLTMHTGHAADTLFHMFGGKSDKWIKTFFSIKPDYEPGTFFCYDMGAQYVMNELVRIATGEDVGHYLQKRVFDPLGMTCQYNYTQPEGLFFSSTIQFQPEGLTKLSQLYLQRGRWEDKQILREDLVEFMEQCHAPSFYYSEDFHNADPEDCAGYTLHMWRNSVGGYRFCGGQGQYGVVLPEYDMVFSTFAAEDKAVEIVKLFFKHVLRETTFRPMPADARTCAELQYALANYTLGPEDVSDRSSTADRVSGTVYKFEENAEGQDSICFRFLEDSVEITTASYKGERTHVCGLGGQWLPGEGYLLMRKEDGEIADLDRVFNYDTKQVLLTGGWQNKDTFVFYVRGHAILCDYRFYCTFRGDELKIVKHTRCHTDKVTHMGMASKEREKALYAKKN